MIIKTENLILRTVTKDDVSEVARMWNFETGEISEVEALRAITNMIENHERNKLGKIYHICFAVFEKNEDKIIGWCGLDGGGGNNKDETRTVIFYLIDKDYRNHGYATECGKELLKYGFIDMKLDKIEGGCVSENIPSKKVLEKIGMKHMTHSDDDGYDFYLTQKEYKSYDFNIGTTAPNKSTCICNHENPPAPGSPAE